MHDLPPLAPGFVRLAVHLRGPAATPGEVARAAGVPAEDLGPIAIQGATAYVDVRSERGREAREALRGLGQTQLADRHWQWLRIAVGRNHGLSMGQLRRILQAADALPAGRIVISNTHTLVGLQDERVARTIERLSTVRINGFAARPSALPLGTGPGPAAYNPGSRPPRGG